MIQGELSDAQWFWIIEQSLKTPYYVAAAKFAAGMFSDYREEAKQIAATVPALHICAEHWADTAVPFVTALMPQTKTAVLGGHMMFWEHAGKFNAIVDEFLAGI
jgi:pimeloyl-ACP methyl ester carboxylesterase